MVPFSLMLFSKNKSVYRLMVFFLVALCFLSLMGRNFWFEITKNLLIIGLLLPEDICLGFLLVGWLVGLCLYVCIFNLKRTLIMVRQSVWEGICLHKPARVAFPRKNRKRELASFNEKRRSSLHHIGRDQVEQII